MLGHSRIAPVCAILRDCRYISYIERLRNQENECQAVSADIQAGLALLKQLSNDHSIVMSKTSTLHHECEHLMRDKLQVASRLDPKFCNGWMEA